MKSLLVYLAARSSCSGCGMQMLQCRCLKLIWTLSCCCKMLRSSGIASGCSVGLKRCSSAYRVMSRCQYMKPLSGCSTSIANLQTRHHHHFDRSVNWQSSSQQGLVKPVPAQICNWTIASDLRSQNISCRGIMGPMSSMQPYQSVIAK